MIKTVSAISLVASALVGYLVYFDYRRRTDPAFRTYLREQRNTQAQERLKDLATRSQRDAQDTLEALRELDAMLASPLPTTPADREAFFISQLKVAEDFMGRGPVFYEASARNVLGYCSDPMQLMMVFEQSLPQPVFALIMDLMASEMKGQGAQEEQAPIEEMSTIDELVE